MHFKDGHRKGGIGETLAVTWPLALALTAGTLNHLCSRYFLAQSGDAALEAILPAEMLSALPTGFLTAVIGYSATLVAAVRLTGSIYATG